MRKGLHALSSHNVCVYCLIVPHTVSLSHRARSRFRLYAYKSSAAEGSQHPIRRRTKLMSQYLELKVKIMLITVHHQAEDPRWCSCGLCSTSWKNKGWLCDGSAFAYLPSGREVALGTGCRERIAADHNVPPGFIGRRGTSLLMSRCTGRGCLPPDSMALSVYEKFVPILPREYYSDMILDLMLYDLYVGADGSAFAVNRLRIHPRVFHVREKRMGIACALLAAYRIVFESGYRSSSFLLDVELGGGRSVWLSHEVIATKSRSRCCSAITYLQRRFRRGRGAS